MNWDYFWAQAILWSSLWIGFIALSLYLYPFTLAHDYPTAVQVAANLPKPSKHQKKMSVLFGTIGFILLFGMVIFWTLGAINRREIGYDQLFFYVWALCMSWNCTDLVIVDWLLICYLKSSYFVLPGTSKHPANVDYMFHFKGFLKGCITMSVFATILAAICYVLK